MLMLFSSIALAIHIPTTHNSHHRMRPYATVEMECRWKRTSPFGRSFQNGSQSEEGNALRKGILWRKVPLSVLNWIPQKAPYILSAVPPTRQAFPKALYHSVHSQTIWSQPTHGWPPHLPSAQMATLLPNKARSFGGGLWSVMRLLPATLSRPFFPVSIAPRILIRWSPGRPLHHHPVKNHAPEGDTVLQYRLLGWVTLDQLTGRPGDGRQTRLLSLARSLLFP